MGGFNNSIWSGTAGTPIPPPPAQDIYVKVSAADTTTGYLSDKVVNDGCNDITLSIVNPGGNEQLGIKTNITRGNTLFVSKTGDDATASRENMACHYETVEAAIADAQSGDTVVVYTGVYLLSTPIQKQGVSVYLMPFAELSGNGVPVAQLHNNELFFIYGNGILSATGAAVIDQNSADSYLTVECDFIVGSTGVVYTIWIVNGTFSGKVNQSVNCSTNAGALYISGTGNVNFFCPTMADGSTSDADRPGLGYTIIYLLNYSGRAFITCDSVIGWQGGPTIAIQSTESSYISLTANYMKNNWAGNLPGGNTSVLNVLATGADKSANNCIIKGNIYATSRVRGLIALYNNNTGRLYFEGNIWCELGYGVYNCSSDYMIDHNGDVVQIGSSSAFGAVRVGLDNAGSSFYAGGTYKNKNGTISTESTTEPPVVVEINKTSYPDSKVIFKETTLIELGGLGYCVISGDASVQEIYIYKAESNVDVDVATITNGIAPTTLIIDTNIVL